MSQVSAVGGETRTANGKSITLDKEVRGAGGGRPIQKCHALNFLYGVASAKKNRIFFSGGRPPARRAPPPPPSAVPPLYGFFSVWGFFRRFLKRVATNPPGPLAQPINQKLVFDASLCMLQPTLHYFHPLSTANYITTLIHFAAKFLQYYQTIFTQSI